MLREIIFTTCSRSLSLSKCGRPPATESSPRHAGDSVFLLMTVSKVLRRNGEPSFFLTCFNISLRFMPPRCMPQMTPRVQTSSLTLEAFQFALHHTRKLLCSTSPKPRCHQKYELRKAKSKRMQDLNQIRLVGSTSTCICSL